MNRIKLIWLLIGCLLSGCATRPGADVLTPVAMAPEAKVVSLYVATTRERQDPGSNVFNNERSATLNYALFNISIPPDHKPSEIEWPDGKPDARKHFVTVGQQVLTGRQFFQGVRRYQGGSKKQDVIVFVHGYNSSLQEALFRLAQMNADSHIQGTPILFAWPSQAKVSGYIADKDSVTYSRDYLVQLLTTLAEDPQIGKVVLFAHSMGSWLSVEALRQLKLSGKVHVLRRLDVALAAPDIDVDVFRSQIEVIGPMASPMVLLVSKDDKALSVSNKISADRERVGVMDVSDPDVQKVALKANLTIIDISSIAATDAFRHNRFASLAALYPHLRQQGLANKPINNAGAFVLNTVGSAVSSPFRLAGQALGGE